jgi:transcription antitermination factor NusG
MITLLIIIGFLGSGRKPLGLDEEEMTSILAMQTSEKRNYPSGDASRWPSNHVIAVVSLSKKAADELE